ncbi:MAG: chromate transporter [Saccharofermentans sp.]|nr:chromate transporter [Saccharofermentans sp.]
MILLDLLIGFLRVGLFSFGGAYGAIPLIRDVVLEYGWLTDEQLSTMIAISESTPGPIMVNIATYVGSSQAGILGAAVATLAVITPAFVIVLLIMNILKNALKNEYVKAVLDGLKPCIIGIVLATGSYMVLENIVKKTESIVLDWKSLILSVVIVAIMIVYKMLTKKKISPILLIVIGAVCGVIVF